MGINPEVNHSNEIRYLTVLSEIASKLKSAISLEQLCSDICKMIISIMRYPDNAVVCVQIGEISRMSPGFHTTSWGLVREFEGADKTKGRFDIYYTSEKKLPEGPPFTNEEEIFLDNIAGLLSGATTKNAFEKLLNNNVERQKELGGIANISSILQENRPIQSLLSDICNVLPQSWQYPEYTGARIVYGDLVFASDSFKETPWMQKQTFRVPEGPSCFIEICYTKEFPECDEGPFLKEERCLIINLAQLLAAAAGSKLYEQLICYNRERLKELNAINQTTQIITHGKSIKATLQSVCIILPESLQYPEQTTARITFAGEEYVSRQFDDTPWVLREQFITIDNQIGTIEVFYLREYPESFEGPFLKEERDLIRNIARLLAHFLNNNKGRILLERSRPTVDVTIADRLSHKSHANYTEANVLFGNHQKGYFTPYVVREVLFIATPYEAFAVQSEGLSFPFKKDPLYPYGIWCAPRITVVNTSAQALEQLQQKQYDMVLIMVGLDICRAQMSIKQISMTFPTMPTYTLINKQEHLSILSDAVSSSAGFKQAFLWNNDPALLFAIIKLHEDVRSIAFSYASVILIIEDSPEVLSKIITRSYQTLFDWVESEDSIQKNVDDKSLNLQRLRPHIIAVSNYEAAIHMITQYQNRLSCVLSDIEFDKNGVMNKTAGLGIAGVIKEYKNNIPCLLYSSELSNKKAAEDSGFCFLDKNIPDLLDKISSFIKINLIKSVFTLRDQADQIIAQTDSLPQLIHLIKTSQPSLVAKHLLDGEFTRWFLAQGDDSSVKEIENLQNSSTNDTLKHQQIINLLKSTLQNRFCGSTVQYERTRFFDEAFLTVLTGGSYGGKGRGLAFLNALIHDLPSHLPLPGLKISTPITAIIGTEEFERIMNSKEFTNCDLFNLSYDEIRKKFIQMSLSKKVKDGLHAFVSEIRTPIAVRSSSLFEDSLTQPFAGAFETYILPNNNRDFEVCLEQLETAVKLVFASLFRPEARTYFTISGKSVQEERMAVVVQQLVGTDFDSYYYPQISGVAGSFNYYPVAHMKPEEGFAVMAFGLGVYVVEGHSGHRFSPSYPEISFGSMKDSLNNSQVKFYAVDLTKSQIDIYKNGEKAGLVLLDIASAEKTGSLAHCASVYDTANDRIVPSLQLSGPRMIDFADILKYEYIPLAETLKVLLTTLAERMGTPIEMEFAITLPNKSNSFSEPTLYLLQVKPLVGEKLSHQINDASVDPQSVILYSETALGNGFLDSITDVLIVDFSTFDRSKTEVIATEVEYFNRKLTKAGKQYVLIGPGRWGTRDKSLGIPVVWAQISNARVIVELGLANYPLDASLGSHFFHNLTSMNTGYMAINENQQSDKIRWDAFTQATTIEQQRYVKHLRFPSPLHIEIDGSKRRAFILWRNK